MAELDPSAESELTIDELAARVGMTVRNVRAYASRGLIPAPRLAGRTGYYNELHVRKLRLIRELIDRGYTLAGVEKLLERSDASAAHALDLIEMLDAPTQGAEEPEVANVDALLAIAGVSREDAPLAEMEGLGVAEWIDDETVRLLQPTLVRAGLRAVALGLDPNTVTAMMPVLSEHLREVANLFVTEVRTQIWQPFVEQDMPDHQWEAILRVIDGLLPVAGQAVLATFRLELSAAISEAMGSELAQLAAHDDQG